MRICDIVSFSKEKYFNGAVQTEWFYDSEKVKEIAESFVFHGPQYYGVSNSDILPGQHKLIDTASFAKNIATKLYSENTTNSFVMTIAGYGTGKSHLAVCLGALFSGKDELANIITGNISKVDSDSGAFIREVNTKKNFVIMLNGMKNFNLDTEVLRCVRLSLRQNGIEDTFLQRLTKSYDIARHFVEHVFLIYEDKFNLLANKYDLAFRGQALKDYLIANVESGGIIIEIINEVYREVNGDNIQWEHGISAGDILSTIQSELCGLNKPFNKVLVLFDEFGRYIEYTAANPTIAGEAALQQIFEAGQSADGNIIFVGFIQYELDAYLSHIEKTSNIIRYVGRYKGSENLFLSSNFETILANLLTKKNDFNRVVESALSRYERFHSKIESALNRWDCATYKKSVWTDTKLYKNVILNGCFPLHPITIWLLSNTSSWMQQRSTIAFVAEMFERINDKEIEGTWLPYIYPIYIIDSGIYNEMLNAEEKGLVQSQFCMLYRDILLKIGNKLNYNELATLKSILLLNIAKFVFRDKEDAIIAIKFCSSLNEEEVKAALKSLEDIHGVTSFDDNSNTYDLIAEANGLNEFKRAYFRYKMGVEATISDIDEDTMKELNLTSAIETSFAQEHHISSDEWNFACTLVDIKEINRAYLSNAIRNTITDYSGESSRGILIYCYCNENAREEIERVARLYKELKINNYPVLLLFLDDKDSEVITALTVKKVIRKFSIADTERFQKHIASQLRGQNKKICQKFNAFIGERRMITGDGLISYAGRINALCSERFNALYTKAVPFVFDGFENLTAIQAKRSLSSLCLKMFDRTLMNIQSYQALITKDKNRVKACLATDIQYSWQVFDDACQLVLPRNPKILEIYQEVESNLSETEPRQFFTLFSRYTVPPYGINVNALALFTVYFIVQHDRELISFYGKEKLTISHLSEYIFKDGKLKISELLKLSIQKNANIGIDLVDKKCKEIIDNCYVENCPALRRQLNDVLITEGESVQNQLSIAQANIRLDEGEKIEIKIQNDLQNARKILEETSSILVIHKFIKIFDYIVVEGGIISDGLPYVYSEKYMQSMREIQKKVDQIIATQYVEALNKVRCKIVQLSQVKTTYKKVSSILLDKGYNELAVITDQYIINLENELLMKNKYESTLIECEKDIRLYSDTTQMGFKMCTSNESKFNNWIDFINESRDMPASITVPLLEKINYVLSNLAARKKSILDRYEQTVEELGNADNVMALNEVKIILEELLKIDLEELINQEISYILSEIEEALNVVSSLPRNLDAIAEIHLEDLEVEFPRCWKVIQGELTKLQHKMSIDQIGWIAELISPVENDVSSMSAQDCANWLEKTKVLPGYLDNKTILRYRQSEALIGGQLHKSRIQGVISMYNNLSETEKAEFRKLIC